VIASGKVVALMDKKPPPPGWRLEGRLVEVTPHPVKKYIPTRPKMRMIFCKVLYATGLSSLPRKRQTIPLRTA
jgi:hypothetical protein